MSDFSFARQPILDESLDLYAYEFLYRPIDASKQFEHSITSEVLTSIIIDTNLCEAANNHLAFINMSYEDIMGEHIEALPTDKVILELLEDIKPTEALNNRAKQLVEMGYTFALDDFVYSPDWDPLIDLCKIIKLDLSVTSLEENKALIKKLHGKDIVFLAEKVETYQQYHEYKDIGCTLFQGYFFCKPEQISGKAIDTSSQAKLRLITELNNPNLTVNGLEEVIQQHPKLVYNLLKYLNSAHFSFAVDISSIKQAIVILGTAGLRSWATILSLRDFSSKPHELRRVSLVRAKLAELLAIEYKLENPHSFFLMGLLSTLDALTDSSIEDILKTMPIDENIKNALLNQKGEMSEVLASVIRHDSNEPLTAASADLSKIYAQAYQWADQVTNEAL